MFVTLLSGSGMERLPSQTETDPESGSCRVERTMIATGCAQRGGVLDWSRRIDVVAFASAREISLALIQDSDHAAEILSTTVAHGKSLACLAFPDFCMDHSLPIDYDALISSSIEGTVAAWSVHRVERRDFRLSPLFPSFLAHRDGHAANVCCCAIVAGGDGGNSRRFLSLSAADDCSILIQWRVFVGEHTNRVETSPTVEGERRIVLDKNAFALCARFHRLTQGSILLAVGDSTSHLNVFCEDSTNHDFLRLMRLSGHSDWIRSLAFREDASGDSLLATAAQDNLVRLWRFSAISTGSREGDNSGELKMRSHSAPLPRSNSLPSVPDNDAHLLRVSVEAVLAGHEAWIHSIRWNPAKAELLSASMDKCIIVWTEADGIWTENARIGTFGGQAVGFYSATFSPHGDCILANSYFGAFHIWRRTPEDTGDRWIPEAAFGGHFNRVTDVAWDPTGTYLLSCGFDQTTRVYSPIAKRGFAEIARPQLHGHDLTCIAVVSSWLFVSGAEEKIFRAFRAPISFAERLTHLAGIRKEQIFPDSGQLAIGSASVPSLGLSNKAMPDEEIEGDTIDDLDDGGGGDVNGSSTTAVNFNILPLEEELMERTLWPEEHKLYGHGSEVYAIAANHRGTLIATSCKASHPSEAEVMLWDTTTWERRGTPLRGHQLTVTQLAFAPGDRLLLSVSRDRCWAIYQSDDHGVWAIAVHSSSLPSQLHHSRIIWGCAWSGDSAYFGTVSRDKKIRLWHTVAAENASGLIQVEACAVSVRSSAVTAVDFCPEPNPSWYTLVIGLENGMIEVLRWSPPESGTSPIVVLATLDQSMAHSATVTRIRFRPSKGRWTSSSVDEDEKCWQFASCSEDHKVKVFALDPGSTSVMTRCADSGKAVI